MLISTITSNIPFIQLSLMHRITEKICKERWQHWCTKISGVKVLPTLLISTITSNMSFIQLSLMLSGYPASSLSMGGKNCSMSYDRRSSEPLADPATSQRSVQQLWLGLGHFLRTAGATEVRMANLFRTNRTHGWKLPRQQGKKY